MLDVITRLFQENLGNRLTVALANGMLMEIGKLLQESDNDDTAAADTDAQE